MNPCEICVEQNCDYCCMGCIDYDAENDECTSNGACMALENFDELDDASVPYDVCK